MTLRNQTKAISFSLLLLAVMGCDAEDESWNDDELRKKTVSALEYCATLDMILANNVLTPEAQAGAGYGWGSAGCGAFPPELLYANWPSH